MYSAQVIVSLKTGTMYIHLSLLSIKYTVHGTVT